MLWNTALYICSSAAVSPLGIAAAVRSMQERGARGGRCRKEAREEVDAGKRRARRSMQERGARGGRCRKEAREEVDAGKRRARRSMQERGVDVIIKYFKDSLISIYF